jgi:hypothetical protein
MMKGGMAVRKKGPDTGYYHLQAGSPIFGPIRCSALLMRAVVFLIFAAL